MPCTLNADNDSHQSLAVCADDVSDHSVDVHYRVDYLREDVASQPAILHGRSQPSDEGV